MVRPSLEACSRTLSQSICKLRLPFFIFHQLVVKECLPLLIRVYAKGVGCYTIIIDDNVLLEHLIMKLAVSSSPAHAFF